MNRIDSVQPAEGHLSLECSLEEYQNLCQQTKILFRSTSRYKPDPTEVSKSQKNQELLIRLACAKMIPLNTRDKQGKTPLHHLAECYKEDYQNSDYDPIFHDKLIDAARSLLERGFLPSDQDNNGNTALHQAALAGALPLVETFLNQPYVADLINIQNEREETALASITHMLAPDANSHSNEWWWTNPFIFSSIGKKLIEAGADTQIKSLSFPLFEDDYLGNNKLLPIESLVLLRSINNEHTWDLFLALAKKQNSISDFVFYHAIFGPIIANSAPITEEQLTAILQLGADPKAKFYQIAIDEVDNKIESDKLNDKALCWRGLKSCANTPADGTVLEQIKEMADRHLEQKEWGKLAKILETRQ